MDFSLFLKSGLQTTDHYLIVENYLKEDLQVYCGLSAKGIYDIHLKKEMQEEAI